MKRLLVTFCAAAVLFTSTAPMRAEVFPLQYHSGNPSERGLSVGMCEAVSLAAPPIGLWLPRNAGTDPVFAKWETPLAESGFVYLAATKGPDRRYESLFVDTDGDGNLADESPVKRNEQGWQDVFGPIELVFPGQGPDLKYSIVVQARTVIYMSFPARNVTSLLVETACWYEGDVTLDGRTCRVLLVDEHCNGVFDDVSMTLEKADSIAIGEGDSEDVRQCCFGKYIQVGGKIYHPIPRRTGEAIEFAPPEPFAAGIVRLTGAATTLRLAGENGDLTFDLVDGKTSVPVGKWIPKSWTLTREDAGGVRWTLEAVDFPAKTAFEVVETAESVLDTGEPVNARTGWAGYSQGVNGAPAKPVYFFAIGGRIGEVMHITRNGSRPPVPVLHIRSDNGAYDESVAFEYG